MALNITNLDSPTPEINPSFPVITVTTKRDINEETATVETLVAHSDQMLAEGKTDGVSYLYSSNDSLACYIYRNWVNTDAANEWISFVTGVGEPTFTEIKIYN